MQEDSPLLNAPPTQYASLDQAEEESASLDHDRTTVKQTFIHLVKGYMGAGCLSLPWAISQLGIWPGVIALCLLSVWSSYNCWIVVKLKRYIERSQIIDDTLSEPSTVTTNTNITYPDVGDWAYGRKFQSYVTACVCTQQLAICTVFLSFIGENLLAVLAHLNVGFLSTHVGVITVVLPVVMALSFLPNLKTLAPVMAAGTVLLMLTFLTLGVVLVLEWPNRPQDDPIEFTASSSPLALCAILYSYEGINLILPVESAMKEPQHFAPVFVWSMVAVAAMLAIVAVSCVLTFGHVTNGSVTAFLVENYRDDTRIMMWLTMANTFVSLSVLLTYPLQLFPALELLGPWIVSKQWPAQDENDVDDLLDGFEPLPPLPEHEALEEYSVASMPDEHDYEGLNNEADDDDTSKAGMSSVTSFFPELTMPGDSPQLRAGLVVGTYLVAVIVPNVQALISLAGAVAGSSTALLIPPLLELAFLWHLEKEEHDMQGNEAEGVKRKVYANPFGPRWLEKIKCYCLLLLGSVFAGIGTYASIADIVKIYRGS